MTDHDTGASSAGFHRIANFMRCPQIFAYREVLKLVERYEGQYTGRGTVLHTGLRGRYLGLDVDALIQALPERYAPWLPEGMKLYERYCNRYPLDLEGFKVISAEEEVFVKIGGHDFTRRLDLVVEWGGKLVVIDFKTAGRPGARAATADTDWVLATQALVGKAVLAGKYNLPWGGVVIDIVGAGDEPSFERRALHFAPRIMESIPRSILYFYERVEALMEVDPWSWPRTGCCWSPGKCEYMDLCRGGPSWARQYERPG